MTPFTALIYVFCFIGLCALLASIPKKKEKKENKNVRMRN